tara:strand:- start:27426 stop:28172 length:747 start_codon:yes stop_codon:yes gene_type:complete
MQILLSNDDGFLAHGLNQLNKVLADIAKIIVIAPDRDRSGASNSLTLEKPIRADEIREAFYRVNGTPADCIHLAITGLLKNEPDMVISGINSGPNMGDDVIYSGTVGAAIEGRFLAYPAIAISMSSNDPKYYETGAQVAFDLVSKLQISNPFQKQVILNINVPDLPYNEIKGFSVTRLGCRQKPNPAIRHKDPRGHDIFWVGSAGNKIDSSQDTDFFAVENGFVSITPLKIDLTNYGMIEPLREWLSL